MQKNNNILSFNSQTPRGHNDHNGEQVVKNEKFHKKITDLQPSNPK